MCLLKAELIIFILTLTMYNVEVVTYSDCAVPLSSAEHFSVSQLFWVYIFAVLLQCHFSQKPCFQLQLFSVKSSNKPTVLYLPTS